MWKETNYELKCMFDKLTDDNKKKYKIYTQIYNKLRQRYIIIRDIAKEQENLLEGDIVKAFCKTYNIKYNKKKYNTLEDVMYYNLPVDGTMTQEDLDKEKIKEEKIKNLLAKIKQT